MVKDFFIFDVESIGLHGEAFAVSGGVFVLTEHGLSCQYGFNFACPDDRAKGSDEDRKWVHENIPVLQITHRSLIGMRQAFWKEWEKAKAKYPKIVMAAECPWPVEGRFLNACVEDDISNRRWGGPYPFIDISSVMLAAGMDPMIDYERTPSELPKHDPWADVVQSARLLGEALLKGGKL